MTDCSLFDGWDMYPLNLFKTTLDADAARCRKRLSNEAQRLFIPSSEECQLKVWAYNFVHGKTIRHANLTLKQASDLKLYLSQGQPQSAQIFFINQAYSWGPLLITDEVFKKLATALKLHPGFLDVVHTFGERVAPVEESSASLFTRMQPNNLEFPAQYSYEIAYNFKYVARHGRSTPQDPFSIRQVGVYHQFEENSFTSNWVFLQAPDNLQARLASDYEGCEVSELVTQSYHHAAVFQCLSEDWREYVNHLEDALSTLMDRGLFSNITPVAGEGRINADFGDIRLLQVMTDKLKRLFHILQLNVSLCQRLQAFLSHIYSLSNRDAATGSHSQDTLFDNCIFHLETQRARVKSMISRADGIGSMIEHVLDVRNTQTAHNMNSTMHELSKRSAEENKLVRMLASQSTKDTRSMKVIAFISSIFLPATFVATFFGSNFFGFESTSDGNVLAVASNVWIYMIVALAFSAIAMTLWYWWYSRKPSVVEVEANV
ncbi:hypothetical protein FB567DRAFT_574833 [Paraphoma chrysanthemicola]|uniref:CorA-like transporter domain-containing protein n=1 Tax=Paraphoma chrysanthemicola TaxID=798071 RepID=A0A8K0W453_9PLEO|nr:hypothetical protein FB567DRAFT_574833 [Paraphoma chrysanthemicola]